MKHRNNLPLVPLPHADTYTSTPPEERQEIDWSKAPLAKAVESREGGRLVGVDQETKRRRMRRGQP